MSSICVITTIMTFPLMLKSALRTPQLPPRCERCSRNHVDEQRDDVCEDAAQAHDVHLFSFFVFEIWVGRNFL